MMTYDLEPHGQRWLGFGGLLTVYFVFQATVEVVNQFNFNFDMASTMGVIGSSACQQPQETIFATIFPL